MGKALGYMHGSPSRRWTVDGLAREIGVSRSALADRFTTLIGRSPMHYLTQWRLALAAHLLQTTTKTASVVAFEVGYDSEAAFSRAFQARVRCATSGVEVRDRRSRRRIANRLQLSVHASRSVATRVLRARLEAGTHAFATALVEP